MSSKFGQIKTQTTELAALERWKNLHIIILGKLVSPYFLGCFDRILFILAGSNYIHKSLDKLKIRPNLTTD